VQATLTGRLEWPETHYLVDLWAELPVTECNTVLSSVPPALLGSNASFSFGGRVRARSVLRIDSRNVESTRFDVALANGCRFESVPALADLTRFRRPFLHRVRDGGRVVFEMTTGPGTARWTPLRDVSPFIVQAVLGHEDGAFFRHGGIDVAALRRALTRNLEAGRFVYGGSTITMQLVKNLFLDREKTVARKLQELLLTWWIETAMTKAEILELYLNVIEYGPRLFGIGPATLYYFGRPASEVTAAEAAYLATILPNPGRFHRETIRDGALTPRWARRTRRFVRRLGQVNRFDDVATADALEQLEDFRFGGVPGAAGAPERPARGGVRRLPLEGMSVWEDPEAAAEEAAEVREEEEAWTWP
jgi:penicillin-binding protein 1A